LVLIDVGGVVETIFERVGALDVHKAQVTACVRVPGAGGRRDEPGWVPRRPGLVVSKNQIVNVIAWFVGA
jgi:hypothetical protein